MRFLLDTHALLWFIGGDSRLSTRARAAIEDINNTRLFSIACLWELGIKVSAGKLNLSQPFKEFVTGQLSINSIMLLDVEPDHINEVVALPYHHRDPFDRLLIAQAIVEQIPIVSVDSIFDSYPITRLW